MDALLFLIRKFGFSCVSYLCSLKYWPNYLLVFYLSKVEALFFNKNIMPWKPICNNSHHVCNIDCGVHFVFKARTLTRMSESSCFVLISIPYIYFMFLHNIYLQIIVSSNLIGFSSQEKSLD